MDGLNLVKWDDLGVPLFLETSICGYHVIFYIGPDVIMGTESDITWTCNARYLINVLMF